MLTLTLPVVSLRVSPGSLNSTPVCTEEQEVPGRLLAPADSKSVHAMAACRKQRVSRRRPTPRALAQLSRQDLRQVNDLHSGHAAGAGRSSQ
jgi:hypothetical protein